MDIVQDARGDITSIALGCRRAGSTLAYQPSGIYSSAMKSTPLSEFVTIYCMHCDTKRGSVRFDDKERIVELKAKRHCDKCKKPTPGRIVRGPA